MALLDDLLRGRPRTATRPAQTASPRIASQKLVILALAVVSIAALIPLVQNSDLTGQGGELRRLERTRDEWRARVHATEAEVASLASLERVEHEATTRLGMVPPSERIYVTSPVSGPADPAAPSRYIPEPSVSAMPDTSSSWWERVLQAVLP